jgi:hypothetical protein
MAAFGLVVLAAACERPNPLYVLARAHHDAGGLVDDAAAGGAGGGSGGGAAAHDAAAGAGDGAGARPVDAEAGTGTAPGTGRDSGPDSSSGTPLADAASAPVVWKGDVSGGLATTIMVGGAEQANGTVTARFTGKVDDVLVYTRALAQQDVQDLSAGSRPPVR